jgi:hypothetical protein
MRNLVKRVSVMKIEGLPVIDVATWSTSFAARVRRTSRAHYVEATTAGKQLGLSDAGN